MMGLSPEQAALVEEAEREQIPLKARRTRRHRALDRPPLGPGFELGYRAGHYR
jgi:hypothetical protein